MPGSERFAALPRFIEMIPRFIIRHFGMICFVNNMFPSFVGQIDRIPVPVFNNPSFSGLHHFKSFRHFEGFNNLLSLDLSL